MAARFMQLLCMSYNVCMILHVCSLQGVNCDVPDGVVYTDLHKTAKKGDELVLKCQFYGTPIAVYWKKGDEPRKSPDLITWVEGESASGSCVNDELCYMSANFSLIIRNLTVSDQGTYICRVSNYKGILIHNFTEVNVFAPPTEPFPLIDECRGILPNYAEQTCSLSISNTITITCSASSYFPDIDLFFLHGSIKVDATHIKEDANMDGTKNKSIFIVAEPSESRYVCVASDIPGSQDQRTVTITVTLLESTVTMTTSSNQTTVSLSPSGGVAKVVVPVIVVILILAAICVAIILWRRRKQQRNQEEDDQESMPLRPDTQINVPEHLQKAISPQEVESFVYRLTERHCKRLANAVGITDEKKIATIMDENDKELLLIQSMVRDWIDVQECGNFEKRCRLDDATIKIGRHDITDSFGTTSYRVKAGGVLERPHPDAKTFNSSSIFDDDLASLLRHLPTGAIPLFLEKLGISVDKEEDDLEQKLKCWRDHNINESKRHCLLDVVLIHRDALNETNDSHVLDLNNDELEDLIACMTTKQVEELTSTLGIENNEEQSPLLQLKGWRDRCKKEERRQTLRKALHVIKLSGGIVDRLPSQHVYQAELLRLARTMFSIDVWLLATLLDMDMMKDKNTDEPRVKGTLHLLVQLSNKSKQISTHRRRDFCVTVRDIGYLDVARSAYLGYDASLSEVCNVTSELSKDETVKLAGHLGLKKDVLSVCQGTTGVFDNVKLMKIWRDQLRPEPLHLRLKLALGLRAVGRTKIASRILSSEHHTTEIDSRVVENICNGLEDDQMERLREHLRLKAQDGQNLSTATLVTEWVRNWLEEFDKFSMKKLLTDKIVSRRNENNNLFRVGFVKLAEEVMLLEISRIGRVKPANKEREKTSCEDKSEI